MTRAKGSLDTLMDGLGIRLIPVWRRRGPGQSHARATIRAILEDHGEAHLVIVLRAIRESRGNAGALWSETIWALSDVLLRERAWLDRPSDLFAALDCVDLNAMRDEALALRPWPVRSTLRANLHRALRDRMADLAEVA
ncbi:hypothetical protein LA66_00105 [Aureimonas altamirensis]|uniref:Uncharacterized protein n=1 Tax=Aureimonas altamirensis TaxID=370622 RepID=A0A0B1Q430_9HYPH|nr:hypothetical protein [Aureimonas altamirensis]KHJ55129.1 hypothetical protein LA66_00105 [Aureimonas altamirensis]